MLAKYVTHNIISEITLTSTQTDHNSLKGDDEICTPCPTPEKNDLEEYQLNQNLYVLSWLTYSLQIYFLLYTLIQEQAQSSHDT